MPFEKGIKKKGGRKKGSLNKKTEVANAFVEYIIEKGYDDIDELWKELKPKERMDAITKLMDFAIPKHARIEDRTKIPTTINVNLIPASPERLEQQNTIDITHEEIDERDSGEAID